MGPPYYSQHAVFVSPLSAFSLITNCRRAHSKAHIQQRRSNLLQCKFESVPVSCNVKSCRPNGIPYPENVILQVFTAPRNTYIFYKHGLCCRSVYRVRPSVRPSVCLSVCLFVAFVYCIKTADDIVKLLSRPGSLIILVFDAKHIQFQGNPSNEALNMDRVGKYEVFD